MANGPLDVPNEITRGIETGKGYTKFPDGTLICVYYVSYTVPASGWTQWNNLYYHEIDLTSETWGAVFVFSPYVVATSNSDSTWVMSLKGSSKTNVGKLCIVRTNNTNVAISMNACIIAYGRWK